VTVSTTRSTTVDDSFDYFFEVRYVSGESCLDWDIQFFGHDCD
jgi:hypothetical protein